MHRKGCWQMSNCLVRRWTPKVSKIQRSTSIAHQGYPSDIALPRAGPLKPAVSTSTASPPRCLTKGASQQCQRARCPMHPHMHEQAGCMDHTDALNLRSVEQYRLLHEQQHERQPPSIRPFLTLEAAGYEQVSVSRYSRGHSSDRLCIHLHASNSSDSSPFAARATASCAGEIQGVTAAMMPAR